MRSKVSLLFLVVVMLVVSGCSTWRKLNNTERGAILGGAGGAVVGDAVSPGVGGTLLGGAAGAVGGGLIGREMDRNDRRDRDYYDRGYYRGRGRYGRDWRHY
jgi:uncharacterized protein YcfJ